MKGWLRGGSLAVVVGAAGGQPFVFQVAQPEERPCSGNRPPVAVQDELQTDTETSVIFDVTANDSDPDGDGVRVLWAYQAEHGDVARMGNSYIRYTPDGAFVGIDKFHYVLEDGCGQDVALVTVRVAQANFAPTAAFTGSAMGGPAPLTVEFDASASWDPDGAVVLYSWDFGDGTRTDLPEAVIQHTFSEPGCYEVRLWVTDDEGARDTVARWVDAGAPLPDRPVVAGAVESSVTPRE